jgi:membrane dipeptidase
MGRQVIAEMNRVGLVVDMSHSAERSTLEAIEVSSTRPIAITHANPASWHPGLRNKSDTVLRALAKPAACWASRSTRTTSRAAATARCRSFCEMIARTAEVMGIDRLAIGSDLCQDQPDSVVEWMRVGRWTKRIDYGEGSADAPGFPPQPGFFRDNRDFPVFAKDCAMQVRRGERDAILGGNWLRFFDESFGSMP